MLSVECSSWRQLRWILFMAVLLLRVAPAAGAADESAQAVSYQQLDQFARQLPEQHAKTLALLARSLAAVAHSDQDKARLIFAWLATHIAYDTGYLQGRHPAANSPADVLQVRRAICQGYADTFTALASRMQLPAFAVTGYSRTRPEQAMPLTPNHAWNVYLAGGTWHLVDATWAAGGVSVATVFVRSFDPLWFDTPPATFIFSHLPVDSTRQLLPEPIARAQASRWPYVDAELFRRGVSGASLVETLSHGLQPESLPRFSPTPYEARIERAPLSASLLPRQPVTFCFSVAEDTEVIVENGSRTWLLPATGDCRQLTLQPEPGPLTVVLRSRKYTAFRFPLLHYRVSPVLPLREVHRRYPSLPPVAYLAREKVASANLASPPAHDETVPISRSR